MLSNSSTGSGAGETYISGDKMKDQNINKENVSFAKRLLFLYTERKWLLIGTAFGVSFPIGIWGFHLYLQGKGASFGDVLYKTLQLIALNDNTIELNSANWQLELSRIALPGTLAWAVFEGIVLTLMRQFNLFRLARLKDHYIICGLGSKGSVIASELIKLSEGKEKNKVVALDINGSIDENNEHIGALKEAGVLVLDINALDYEWLKKLNPGKAKKIFVMTGNDEINLAVSEKISSLVELSQSDRTAAKYAPQVITNINSPFIWKLTKNSLPKRMGSYNVNVYDISARIVLEEIILSGELKRKTDVNICIFGFGWLVQSLILNLSRQVYLDGLVINVIDGAARKHEKEFFRLYPFLSPNAHQEFYLGERIFPTINFYERDIKQLQREEMKQYIGDDVIFFGLDDDLLEIELAMQIRQMQLTGYGRGKNIVYITESSSLVDHFVETCKRLEIKTLFLHDGIRSLIQDQDDAKAREGHEQYKKSTGDARKYEDLKPIYQDDNQAQIDFWKNYKKWYGMDSRHVLDLDIGDQAALVEELAALEHKRWVSYRVLSGEQFGCAEGCNGQCKHGTATQYACEKDENKNLHPCLVPYEMLSDNHKKSDRNVVRGQLGLVPEACQQL